MTDPVSHLLRRQPSRLTAKYAMTRTAMQLAGGPEEMNDRLAERLRAFFKERGEPFDIELSSGVIAAIERDAAPPRVFMLNCMLYEWRDQDPVIRYDLSGHDPARGIIPVSGHDLLPDDDDFLLLFNAVRDLMGDWPEMRRVLPPGAERLALLAKLCGMPFSGRAESLDEILPLRTERSWQQTG